MIHLKTIKEKLVNYNLLEFKNYKNETIIRNIYNPIGKIGDVIIANLYKNENNQLLLTS